MRTFTIAVLGIAGSMRYLQLKIFIEQIKKMYIEKEHDYVSCPLSRDMSSLNYSKISLHGKHNGWFEGIHFTSCSCLKQTQQKNEQERVKQCLSLYIALL